MKAKTFMVASFFIAVGAFDIWKYSGSGYLAAGVYMIAQGLIIGMMMATMPMK